MIVNGTTLFHKIQLSLHFFVSLKKITIKTNKTEE